MMSPYRHAAAERYGAEAIVGKVVMHMCDNPSCCNPEHLALGTTWDNAQDRTVKGRGYNGHSKRRNEADRWFRDQVMARMREALSGSQIRQKPHPAEARWGFDLGATTRVVEVGQSSWRVASLMSTEAALIISVVR